MRPRVGPPTRGVEEKGGHGGGRERRRAAEPNENKLFPSVPGLSAKRTTNSSGVGLDLGAAAALEVAIVQHGFENTLKTPLPGLKSVDWIEVLDIVIFAMGAPQS